MKNWQKQELGRQLHEIAFQCKSDLIWFREYFKVTRDPWSFNPTDPAFGEQVDFLHQTMQKLDTSMVKLEALVDTDVWKYMRPIRRSYIEYRQAIAAIQKQDPSSTSRASDIVEARWIAVASGSERDDFGRELSKAVQEATEFVSGFMLKLPNRVTPPA